MWNVNDRFPEPLILESLHSLGFKVGSTGGVVRVENTAAAPNSGVRPTANIR